eukprot:gene46960-57501_t
MRVLLVEDDADLSRQLKQALGDAGYAVDHAADGEEAHFLGDTEPYDVVVLDLGLPEIDGLTVLDRWRKEGRTHPVLVLTARDSWSDKVAGLDAGMTFNTWPLIDGAIVPGLEKLGALSPGWRNLFENLLTVQFMHRMAAYALWLVVLAHAVQATRRGGWAVTQAWLLFALVSAQAVVGILTLLFVVPLDLALTHQFGAAVVLIAATLHASDLSASNDRGGDKVHQPGEDHDQARDGPFLAADLIGGRDPCPVRAHAIESTAREGRAQREPFQHDLSHGRAADP